MRTWRRWKRRTGRRRNAREKKALATCGYCDTGPCACWSLAVTKTTSMKKLGMTRILTLPSSGRVRVPHRTLAQHRPHALAGRPGGGAMSR